MQQVSNVFFSVLTVEICIRMQTLFFQSIRDFLQFILLDRPNILIGHKEAVPVGLSCPLSRNAFMQTNMD